jgi:preprotein translocase subunit SecA
MGLEAVRHIERNVMLSSIDRLWMDHLDAMDDLREGIWLRGGKEQAISEYKKEAFDMFARLLDQINQEVIHQIFRKQIINIAQPTMPQNMVTGKQEDFATPPQATVPDTTTPAKSQGVGAFAAALAKTSHKSGKADGRNPILIKPASPDQQKVGRNDPCPCGSGKKYKKCGMIGATYHNA